ncbi:MAG: hypothetical protein QOJ84_4462 [Bradyrhizobium sp.]|jgi:hypothetical protein|nr:hypothetical protein [Bradyrhizobium sp.]
MEAIQITGMDRLAAEELQKLAKIQGLEGIDLEFPSRPTGRPGTLDQVIAILPQLSPLIPLLLTAWIVSSKKMHLKFSRKDAKTGKQINFELEYRQDDPSKVLTRLKEFLGM